MLSKFLKLFEANLFFAPQSLAEKLGDLIDPAA